MTKKEMALDTLEECIDNGWGVEMEIATQDGVTIFVPVSSKDIPMTAETLSFEFDEHLKCNSASFKVLRVSRTLEYIKSSDLVVNPLLKQIMTQQYVDNKLNDWKKDNE